LEGITMAEPSEDKDEADEFLDSLRRAREGYPSFMEETPLGLPELLQTFIGRAYKWRLYSSDAQIADAAGITAGHLSRILSGEKDASAVTLFWLGLALHLTRGELNSLFVAAGHTALERIHRPPRPSRPSAK
jgi:transcriptional regulator with XRE-family HTH domain